MKYFIPAWYQTDKWWASTSVPYYQESKQTDFDDMHSLMKMYYNNQSQFQIIVLNYSPQLRTYLHRHDLFEVPYWSIFDDIQGFTNQPLRLINFRDLSWSDGTEFVYTPYIIRAVTSDSTYTNIYFSQDGYITWFEEFEMQQKVRRFVMDDRGFISSIIYFNDEGHELKQLYLTIDGDVILTENCQDSTVVVNDKYLADFDHSRYGSMSEVIEERFFKYYNKEMQHRVPVIVAADERHNYIISKHIPYNDICFSIFQNRNHTITTETMSSISNGKYWIVDGVANEQRLEQFRQQQQSLNELMRITPFDTQILPNKSSQLAETELGLWIDNIDEPQLQQIMSILVAYIKLDGTYRLKLLTRYEQHTIPSWLLELINIENDQFNRQEMDDQGVTPILAPDDNEIKLIDIVHVPFEKDMAEALLNIRIIIDLGNEPDLYLQICSIGSGVPQINKVTTEYVEDNKNGRIIHDIQELSNALNYFLVHLKNWNYAYASSLKLIDKYTYSNIIKQLDQLIVGENDATSI